MATNSRLKRSISVSTLAASNTSVSNSDAEDSSSVAGLSLHHQRVVVVFAVGELGDGQPIGTRQCGSVDRVVLVHEHRVEQLVVTGDAVNLAERQVLVLEGPVVGVVQLVGVASVVVVVGVMPARTGIVLISSPTIASASDISAGRPETVVPKATSC